MSSICKCCDKEELGSRQNCQITFKDEGNCPCNNNPDKLDKSDKIGQLCKIGHFGQSWTNPIYEFLFSFKITKDEEL